jgi:hypothetical protein
MSNPQTANFPAVALWRVNVIRFIFLLMALIMGTAVWQQVLTEWATMDINRGLAKSMLAALAADGTARGPLPAADAAAHAL